MEVRKENRNARISREIYGRQWREYFTGPERTILPVYKAPKHKVGAGDTKEERPDRNVDGGAVRVLS